MRWSARAAGGLMTAWALSPRASASPKTVGTSASHARTMTPAACAVGRRDARDSLRVSADVQPKTSKEAHDWNTVRTQASYVLAMCDEIEGNSERAVAEYRETLAMDPSFIDASERLAA